MVPSLCCSKLAMTISCRFAVFEVSSCSPQSRFLSRSVTAAAVTPSHRGGAILTKAFCKLFPGILEISIRPPSTKQRPEIRLGYFVARQSATLPPQECPTTMGLQIFMASIKARTSSVTVEKS